MKIAWIQDRTEYLGGAELVCRDILDEVPSGIQVEIGSPTFIPHGDAYVIHNCTSYGTDLIDHLIDRPVIKQVHDLWTEGSDTLRAWLLNAPNVTLLFSSQVHVEKFPWKFSARHIIAPPVVSPERYSEPPEHESKQRNHRAVWIGRMWPGKGVSRALRWARSTGTRVDFYGYGPGVADVPKELYLGALEPEEVPAVLREYSSFVFLPDMVEPYGRTVIEAGWAGCKLFVNRNVGAAEWLSRPEAVVNAREAFWSAVTSNLTKGKR